MPVSYWYSHWRNHYPTFMQAIGVLHPWSLAWACAVLMEHAVPLHTSTGFQKARQRSARAVYMLAGCVVLLCAAAGRAKRQGTAEEGHVFSQGMQQM